MLYLLHEGRGREIVIQSTTGARVARIQPVWTKYFELLSVADEEDGTSGEGNTQSESITENDKN